MNLRSLSALALLCATAMPACADGEFYRDIRPAHWMWNGIDPLVLDATLERIRAGAPEDGPADGATEYGLGEWTYEFERLGDSLVRRADAQEAAGNDLVAAELLSRAAGHYAVAKFPHIGENPDQERTFGKNIDALMRAAALRGHQVEQVEGNWGGQAIDGILTLPADAEGPVPVVVASNGIDVLKGEFFGLTEALLAEGIGLLAYDMAGTGSHSHIRLAPDYEQLPVALMEILRSDPRVDSDRFAIMGVSFGGGIAVKLAMQAPAGLRAAVNVCGPIHSIFQLEAEQIAYVGEMYRHAFADRANLDPDDFEAIAAALKGFSLVDQGLVGEGRKTNVPIFSINARGDDVAPEEDMELVKASTTDGTLVWSGTDDHCPQDRWQMTSALVPWLVERLNSARGDDRG